MSEFINEDLKAVKEQDRNCLSSLASINSARSSIYRVIKQKQGYKIVSVVVRNGNSMITVAKPASSNLRTAQRSAGIKAGEPS